MSEGKIKNVKGVKLELGFLTLEPEGVDLLARKYATRKIKITYK